MYVDGDAVWRGLSEAGLADFEAYAATDAYRAAQADGRLVATTAVPVADAPIDDGWAGALRHERLRVLTYPYEWTFSMLRDAALLQLDLSRAALAEGVLTKDATSYNVQFDGSRPVFIDLGSFERLVPGEPWAGYRQFCELFLNPLYLQAVADIPFQPWLRGSLNGISPTHAAEALGGRKRFRRDLLTHVRLHARAESRYADADASAGRRAGRAEAGRLRAQDHRRPDGQPAARPWSASSGRPPRRPGRATAPGATTPTATSTPRRTSSRAPPAPSTRRWCSTSAPTTAASPAWPSSAGASLAVAVDGDHLVVDHLYRQLRAEGEQRILPLVLDLADPSPALGWRPRERPSFVDRVRPDLVLCLAVIHHLALTNTVPFDEIVAFLHDFGATARGRDAPPRRPDGGPPARPQADRGLRPLRPAAVGGGARAAVHVLGAGSRCPRAPARSTSADPR